MTRWPEVITVYGGTCSLPGGDYNSVARTSNIRSARSVRVGNRPEQGTATQPSKPPKAFTVPGQMEQTGGGCPRAEPVGSS